MTYPDARLAFAKTGLEKFTLSLNLGSQPDSQRYYNDVSEASLAALKAATGARVFRINTNLWSYINDPGFVLATHTFVQACLNQGITPCIAWQNLYTSRGFDENGGQLYVLLAPSDAATASAMLAGHFPSSTNNNAPYIMLDWNEPNQLGEGGYYESSILAWGQAIRAADPHAYICCPAPDYSNDITKILRNSVSVPGKPQWQVFRDAFAPDIYTQHTYNYWENIRSKIDVQGAFSVWVQECGSGTFVSDDYLVAAGYVPNQSYGVPGQTAPYIQQCFRQMLASPDVVSVAPWLYACTADYAFLYMVGSRNPTVFTPTGQIIQDIFTNMRIYGTVTLSENSVSLPLLNSFVTVNTGASALTGNDEIFGYARPHLLIPAVAATYTEDGKTLLTPAYPEIPANYLPVDIYLSRLSEAQKKCVLLMLSAEQSAGDTNYTGGGATDNRGIADYDLMVSADGKAFTLAMLATIPPEMQFAPASVVGNTFRTVTHALNLQGMSTLRLLIKRGRGQQENQIVGAAPGVWEYQCSANINLYDGSSLLTQDDYAGTDGVSIAGDSTATFSLAFQPNMSARIACPGHPSPPVYCNGQPYIQAYNMVHDTGRYNTLLASQVSGVEYLITGANDVPGQWWFSSLKALVDMNRKHGKKTIIALPLEPNGPDTDDGGAAYKVRTALRALYDMQGNVTTSADGMSLYIYMSTVLFAGQADVQVSDALSMWARNNPGLMQDKGLHVLGTDESNEGWRVTLAADIQARWFGYTAIPQKVDAAPVIVPALPASPAPSEIPTPTNSGTALQTPAEPPKTPPVVSLLPSVAQCQKDVTDTQILLNKAVLNLQAAIAQNPLIVTNLFNTGMGAWTVNDAPACIADNSVPQWQAGNNTSKWIAPRANVSAGEQPGFYLYKTTFTLSGDASLFSLPLRFMADDALVQVKVNDAGVVGAANGNGLAAWGSLVLSAGFVAGLNSITFTVQNADNKITPNPTGFRCEFNPPTS